MKKLTILIAVLTLLLTATLLTTTATAQEKEVVVSIPDANLAAAIRETLGLPPAQQFTADAMRNLTRLNASSRGIADLTGLEYAVNLTALDLEGTNVSDVSALASLTNLRMLYLEGTNVSDVSALASLTNLWVLYLEGTNVSDVSALASLTNLRVLDLQGCPLTAAAYQTHIPAIRANGTEVKFTPFKRLVSLIYFRPSDKPVRPNVDAEIDGLIKETQRFFADEMERHGFGRKTFLFEADANGNAVVHHINGKFPYAHYQQNHFSWREEIEEQGYSLIGKNIPVVMIDTFGEEKLPSGLCGLAVGRLASIFCWRWHVIAHELGHAFGMDYHDHRDNRYIMSYGGSDREELSPCFAAWLDVHPDFNHTVVGRYSPTTIQMLPATLQSPNAIRLRFTVTVSAGSLYQARLVTPEKRKRDGHAFNSGGLIGCKRIDGNPTSSTVEFVIALTPDTNSVSVTLGIIGIDSARYAYQSFSIHVGSLADVNRDGVTDQADLAIVSQIVAQTMGKPVENPQADVNGDGVVDGEDFALVAAHLGEGEAAAPSQAALPAGLTLEKVEWALNFLYAENTGSPAFRRGIAKLEGILALLVPDETVLLANYPNPFNPETWIPYQLSEAAEVTVTLHASDGKLVRTLELGQMPAGIYQSRSRAAYWDGRNAAGEPVASGVYFYTLRAGDFSATRKMVIRK